MFLIGTSKMKLDWSVQGYDLIIIDCSRGVDVSYFVKHSVAYSYNASIYPHTEIIFREIHLPKLKSFVLVILSRSPDKTDFFKCIGHIFSQFKTIEIQ